MGTAAWTSGSACAVLPLDCRTWQLSANGDDERRPVALAADPAQVAFLGAAAFGQEKTVVVRGPEENGAVRRTANQQRQRQCDAFELTVGMTQSNEPV